VTERPIIFSGAMVRAILEGRKTQTRRLVRWPKWADAERDFGALRDSQSGIAFYSDGCPRKRMTCPYGQPGDILMPRWASRITLEIISVRVQLLQEITEEDAMAEGVDWPEGQQERNKMLWGCEQTARMRFADIWDSIAAKRAPWDSNPVVWAITFRRSA
jgi:hypothetical protein